MQPANRKMFRETSKNCFKNSSIISMFLLESIHNLHQTSNFTENICKHCLSLGSSTNYLEDFSSNLPSEVLSLLKCSSHFFKKVYRILQMIGISWGIFPIHFSKSVISDCFRNYFRYHIKKSFNDSYNNCFKHFVGIPSEIFPIFLCRNSP